MAHDLEAALDEAFAALRRGDLTELGATYALTETILAGLHITDRATASRLRSKAERNAACLLAAARGVRAARRRLAEVGAAARTVTYDAQGRTRAIGDGPRGLTERF
ncbi:MAG: hypothetical protein V4712_06630 [Pseudomonadota bacterium]